MPATDQDLIKFARLVRDMRALQKRFFAGEKTAGVVRQAKDLERHVDRELARILDDQPRLFAAD